MAAAAHAQTPAAPRKPAARPGPVDDPTLRTGTGRKAPPPGKGGSLNFGRGGRAAEGAVAFGLKKAMGG